MKNRIIVNMDAPGPVIDRHVYGHFAEHLGHCIYGGFFVKPDSGIPNKDGIRLDVVEALKRLNIPNLRWPGGCFADEYHWQDGIGPREKRPVMVNTHWGGVTEDNSFGTHEFLELCSLLECEPYITGNLGSGTVREMSRWVEYLNFDGVSPMTEERKRNGREKPWNVKFWGLGNENWGCGGGMRPEFYADQVRRYATYCRNYGAAKLFKIACGPAEDDYNWTDVLMRSLVACSKGLPPDRFINGLALHYYTLRGTWQQKGSATEFGEEDWYVLMSRAWRMDELITRHCTVMDRYDPARVIALVVDEWGTWHDPEPGTNPGFLYQQNTLRDALSASLQFDIFHAHADRVRMANIAQTVNVLQAMILTDAERMILTPTYHVFEMNKGHQGAVALPLFVTLEEAETEVDGKPMRTISVSASRREDNRVLVSLTNLDTGREREVSLDLRGGNVKRVSGRILTADRITAHNTFAAPETVRPAEFKEFRLDDGRVTVKLPAHSFVTLELSEKA
jgi:alpha-N-arabinofuranosidase